MEDLLYCYPGSDVLKNKLGIRNQEKLRKVDISKGNMFCRVMYLPSQSEVIFSAIQRENWLRGLDRDSFAKRIAYYCSELNALHPFREGNGRTQREFIRELALYNGYAVDYFKAKPDEMFNASVDSFLCKYDKMEALFDKCLRKM